MCSARFQNLFCPKAYSADTIPAGKHNKLPEFQEKFRTDENSRRDSKHSELKRVGDKCRATDEQFYVWNLHMYAKAHQKHALVHKRSKEKLGG